MTKEEAQMLLKSNFQDPIGSVDYEGKLEQYSTYVRSQDNDPNNFIPYIKIADKEFTLQEYNKLVYDN